jgi:CRISPR-associated protein Csx3
LHAAPDAVVAALRFPGDWTPEAAARIGHAIARRHLPLLLDAGGASPEIERIAAHCTHALLLADGRASLATWRAAIARNGQPLLAEIQLSRDGAQRIDDAGSPLRGTIGDPAHHDDTEGPCYSALIERLARLCAYNPDELYRAHLAMTEIDLVIHIERAIHPLPAHGAAPWRPDELPVLLDSLPAGEPLAIYGCGPAWLYAALAAFAGPAGCAVFDARAGWVDLPHVALTPDAQGGPLRIAARTAGDAQWLRVTLPGGYLDERDVAGLAAPAPPSGSGVVLDGSLPPWLWAALARAYAPAAWVACLDPRLQRSVVVCSRRRDRPIGSVFAVDAPLD